MNFLRFSLPGLALLHWLNQCYVGESGTSTAFLPPCWLSLNETESLRADRRPPRHRPRSEWFFRGIDRSLLTRYHWFNQL
jgi:hypothetical protein